MCGACISSCLTCQGVITNCASCRSDSARLINPVSMFGSCTLCSTISGCTTCNYGTPTLTCIACTSRFIVSMNVCVPCDANCLTCTGTVNNCASCNTNATLNMLVTPNVCTLCSTISGCTTCNYIGSTLTCITCTPPQALNAMSVCAACDANCLTCTGTVNNCVTCNPNAALNTNIMPRVCTLCSTITSCATCFYPGSLLQCTSCISPLALTTINSNICGACASPCATCSIVVNNCTSCISGQVLIFMPSLETLGQCGICSSPCLTCSATATTCTSCITGYRLISGTTMCQCNPGLVTGCAACSYNIDGMPTTANCTSCLSNAIPNGAGGCILCASPCATCSGSTTNCTSCIATYFRINTTISSTTSTCVSSFPSGTLTFGNTCFYCASSCATCSGSLSNCASCTNPTFRLVNGNCLPPCAATQILLGVNCQPCHTNCFTCTGNPTNCTSCFGVDMLITNPGGLGRCQRCNVIGCRQCASGNPSICQICNNNKLPILGRKVCPPQ